MKTNNKINIDNIKIGKLYYWEASNWCIQKGKLIEIKTIETDKGIIKLLTFKTGISEKQYSTDANLYPDFYESIEDFILNNNF